MLKRFFAVPLLIAALVLLTGMGTLPQGESPVPKVDFGATITDDQGIQTRCRNLSWEGKTFFFATRGKGTITIPFEKVRKVAFLGLEDQENIAAQVTLKTGEVVAVNFSSSSRVFGTTNYGSYRIMAKNLKELVFE